jgi:mannose-6-phosphate isomerase-like protein (cupin superfamily)
MIIAYERQAPSLEIEDPHRRTLKVLLSPALDAAVESIAVGLSIIPPGSRSDCVGHPEREMFYVLHGEGTLRVEEELEPIGAGAAIWVPANVTHQLINTGSEVLKVLWVLSPPGREAGILEKCGPGSGRPGRRSKGRPGGQA